MKRVVDNAGADGVLFRVCNRNGRHLVAVGEIDRAVDGVDDPGGFLIS
jgi:hypothetical protein